MAVDSIPSGTGSACLPDIGKLSYNGVVFSSLYSSVMTGTPVLDNANRTVKYVKYKLVVDGIVTLNDQQKQGSIDTTWQTLRKYLQQQAGPLIYSGKGFGSPFSVNVPGSTLFDVAWGPIPELLEFTPLGGNLSSRIKFAVTFSIPEIKAASQSGNVLQFNEETFVTYDEAGFSHIIIRGTLEIPFTRPMQTDKSMSFTVDSFRQEFMIRISSGFDLTRFTVSHRDFHVTADKRTLNWSFQLDELGWMGLPGGMLDADGGVSMRLRKPGAQVVSQVQWLMSIRATYIVPNGKARRLAWMAFLAMWNYRMRFSEFGYITPIGGVALGALGLNLVTAKSNDYADRYNASVAAAANAFPGPANVLNVYSRSIDALPNPTPANKSFPLGISYEEGLYKSSKTISFEANWYFISKLSNILIASGLWRKTGLEGGSFWAQSIANIVGGKSWLENKLDPKGAAIVDFGG